MMSAAMELQHLQELIEVEESYWWHVAKRRLVHEVLRRFHPPPARLVEFGVGGGLNLQTLQQTGYSVRGFDIMPESARHCVESLGLDVSMHDIETPWPVEEGGADVVILLDVLEHLEHPASTLRNAAGVLSGDGGIVITVPAIPALMGPWDEAVGHRRRYSPALLRAHVAQAGLTIRWLSYWNSFSLPAAIPARLIQRLLGGTHSPRFTRVPSVIGSLCLTLADWERAFLIRHPLPLGLSLIAVITK